MTRVLIADDHHLFREGLRSLFAKVDGLEVAAEASRGDEAYELIRACRPDVAILDVAMPGATGLEVAARIASERIECPVVLLTMYTDLDLLEQALDSGVRGYVLKESAFEELVFAIRQAEAGGVFVSPLLRAKQYRSRSRKSLTRRELEILGLVARGLTSRQIGEALEISLKTVETHRTNIMRKLEATNSAEAIRHAAERGLLRR